MAKLRIVGIGGNIGEDAVSFSTENAFVDAFRGLGHEVTCVNQRDLCGLSANGVTDEIMARAGAVPDMVWYCRTHNDTALKPHHTEAWRQLEGLGAATCSIHLDLFWGLPERISWMQNGDPLFTTGTVFTPDGGSERHWAELKINHVWLPPGADLRNLPEHVEPREDLDGKVIFVGSEHYHRSYSWRPELIRWLRRTYRDRFVQFGNGSENGAVRGLDLARIYAADCAVVGDHCFAGTRRPSHYWSDRTPESLGRGALLLQPTTEGMEDWYTAEDLIYWQAGDLAALTDAVERVTYMSYEERLAIREHGKATVASRDTYPHRAAQVLQTLGLE